MSTDSYLLFLEKNKKGQRVYVLTEDQGEVKKKKTPFFGGGTTGSVFQDLGNQIDPVTAELTHSHGKNEKLVKLNIAGLSEELFDNSGKGPGSINISMLIWGRPGIGKSAIAAAIAENKIAPAMGREFIHFNRLITGPLKNRLEVFNNPKKYYVFIDIRAGAYEKYEFKGIPQASKAIEGTVESLDMQWVKLMTMDDSAGFLFLDEINQADPPTQGVLFSLFHNEERILAEAGIRNPSCWSVHGAGNLNTGNVGYAGTQNITRALINRCAIYYFDVEFSEWLDWAKTFKKNNVEVYDDLVLGFLGYKLGSKGTIDKDAEQWFSYEDPSYEVSGDPNPRNFAMLSLKIRDIISQAKAGTKDKSRVLSLILRAARSIINNKWAEEFVYYIERFQKNTVEKMLAAPDKYLTTKHETNNPHGVEKNEFYVNMSIVNDWIKRFIPEYLEAFNYGDYINGVKNMSQHGEPPAPDQSEIDVDTYNLTVSRIFNIIDTLVQVKAPRMDVEILTNSLTESTYTSAVTGRKIKVWSLFLHALSRNNPSGYTKALEIAGGSKALKGAQTASGLGALRKAFPAPQEDEEALTDTDFAEVNRVLKAGIKSLKSLEQRL